MTDYVDIVESEGQLAASLQRVQQERAALEREAAIQAEQAGRAVWQEHLDTYDPDALRQAVIDTWQQCLAAARGDDKAGLSTRITQHFAAMLREGRHAAMARDAVGHGGVPREGLKIPQQWQVLNAEGSVFTPDATEAVPLLYARVIHEAADTPSRDEMQALADRAAAARQAALLAEPTGYRISAPALGSCTDVIGGHGVEFTDGIAHVMRANLGDHMVSALVRYWRERPDAYEVTEIYGEPIAA